MRSKDHKRLIVWQKSMDLSRLVYEATANFPENEKFNLVTQMKRSAISIPSNIAEGNRRGSQKECRRFIEIALGSGAELETQIILAQDFGFISEELGGRLSKSIDEVMRLLGGLEKSINAKINGETILTPKPTTT